MLKVLTKEQIEQYNDEGFISPVRVISEQEAVSTVSPREIEKLTRFNTVSRPLSLPKLTDRSVTSSNGVDIK